MATTNAKASSLRISKLRSLLRKGKLEGIILVPGPNLKYFTGVKSLLLERPFLLFLPNAGPLHLLAPTFEGGQFDGLASIQTHTWDDNSGPNVAFEELTQQLSLNGRWGVEGRTPFRFMNYLAKYAQPTLDDAEPILQEVREVKDSQELGFIQRAASILSDSFMAIPSMIERGISESELAGRIAEKIRSNGANVDEVLVQFGSSAADPHHLPSARKLKREGLVVDATCTYSDYYADLTRTFLVGTDPKFAGLYQSVLHAQEEAIDACRVGIDVGAVDEAARAQLRRSGLGDYFVHRTGHGLGLEVHESPYIVAGGGVKLRPGMVFTVEPGVYLPRRIGIRIEDDILMSKRAGRNLTRSLPKDYGWWS